VRLTERRKQFLRGVVDMYRRTRLPVHYETLAERLGVSKWTAYDVLRALEEQGLLTRDYTVNRGEPGRSQIVFVPTPPRKLFLPRQGRLPWKITTSPSSNKTRWNLWPSGAGSSLRRQPSASWQPSPAPTCR